MAAGVEIMGLGQFDHNPRGNLWAKDESTFGYKLLKKMGWNKGQGLGRNNDGISESIKIKKKNTNNGLGYQHQVTSVNELEYDSILSNLSKKYTSLNKGKSSNLAPGLEQRSQQFKNRLHYRKFIQGKDICRYSERDMKSIFLTGKTEEKETKSIPKMKPTTDVNTKHDFCFMYDSSTNMEDYFSKKLKSKPSDSLSDSINHADNEDNSTNSISVANNEDSTVANFESIPKKKQKIHSDINKVSKKMKLQNSDQCSIEKEHAITEASVTVESETSDLPLVIENNTLPIKEKKHKKSKVQLLKSCLKKIVNPSGFKKNVSFNDTIDYKPIEDVFLEKVVICEPSEIINDVCDQNRMESETDEESTDCKILSTTTEITDDEKCVSELDDIEISDEDIKKCKCLHFPKLGRGISNSWIESQKQASKLTLYKNVIKNIKRHHILQTTNLLDIKGYGNWRF